MTDKKKIFDIAPPQKELREEPPKESLTESRMEPLPKKAVPKVGLPKGPVFNKKFIPLIAGAVFLSASSLSYFLIPHKATVELWPKKGNMEETIRVLVGSAGSEKNFVQGEILEVEKAVSRSFSVQGKKLKATKAQGVIKAYNNYSDAPQTLVATTRFISNDGKLFRTLKRAVIPGGHYDGGKLVAGVVDIEVVADQPGQDYNIDASTFSIPGFAGTAKYTSFYAKSSEPMKGGAKEEVSYVVQDDLDEAKKSLTEIVLSETEVLLKDSISSGKYISIEKAISKEAADFTSSAKLGEETDNFSAQVKVKARAIVFKEQALKDFSKNYLLGKLLLQEKLIDASLNAEYSLKTVDWDKNEITLELVISGQSHALPEETLLKETIKNKSLEEVGKILNGFTSIERVEVQLWPFWVSLIPDDLKRIDIVLRLD